MKIKCFSWVGINIENTLDPVMVVFRVTDENLSQNVKSFLAKGLGFCLSPP